MKVCFAGLGSIARRHIFNLKKLFPDVTIDVLHHEKGYVHLAELEGIIHNHYVGYESLPDDYDVVFITNPTSEHYRTLKRLHGNGRHFFIEKPVFLSSGEDIEEIGLRDDSVYYVAAPLRYTGLLQYVKKNIDFSRVYSVRSICSSYLPEWRPDRDYRSCYSARKEMGGGVSLDLIHEWDYLIWLMGFPDRVRSFIGRKSGLEIDSDDIAVYIAEYEKRTVELHLDYFGRTPIRKTEIFSEDDTIIADFINQELISTKKGEKKSFKEERDDYQTAELKYFFSVIEGKDINHNDIYHACKVREIAEGGIKK